MAADEFIGVISDTHGLLRPEALDALSGAALIIHAGDVGKPEVLSGLEQIAPVHAVRGNGDRGEWSLVLPETRVLELAGSLIYVVHDLHAIEVEPGAAGIQVVISGHSHRPSVKEQEGVLYLNPGSAGPRRFTLPVSLAKLRLQSGTPSVELINLQV